MVYTYYRTYPYIETIMALEGIEDYAEQKKKGLMAEGFHLDPKKEVDPVEKLLEDLGPEGAFDELMDRLDKNPSDAETERQAKLLVNRFEDFASRLKGRMQH